MNSTTKRGTILRSERMDQLKAGRWVQILQLGVTLALTVSSVAPAQTYTVLKSFTGWADGGGPQAGLVLADGTLYGTTIGGGSNYGVVFKINTDGSHYTVLKNFTGSDGANPVADLVLAGSKLYGTTREGGSSNCGVVFKVNTDGSGYTLLKAFTRTDGAIPEAGLVLAGSTLYGTTAFGGSILNQGVVFKLNTDGSGYTVLKSFSGSDGVNPRAGLILSGSTLYGTTETGGLVYGGGAYGVVFKLNTDGSGQAVLKSFTGSDGRYPRAGLLPSATTLYGTTDEGGNSNCGVVFKVNADGSDCSVLKSFTGGDGLWPCAALVLAGRTLYGTTYFGGSSNCGVVFKVNTDGSDSSVLKHFTGGADGAHPLGALLLAGNTLYGTTSVGGTGSGVVFSLSLPVPPVITRPPLTQTAEAGTTVKFDVEVTNPVPLLAYQWCFGGTTPVVGGTKALLELTNVQPRQAGVYTVIVTNVFGGVTSSPAMLSVIAPVPRRTVPALTLMGQTETFLNLDSRTALDISANWETFDTVPLTNAPQQYFDLITPLAPQRFYRAWQTNVLSPPSVRDVHLVPAITLTGAIGSSLRVDYINQFGPTDAWVTNLATVTLTNTSQLYFDTSVIGQPARLYRLVPVP